jgi:hypothetical protein
MDDFFDITTYCSRSESQLHHRDVTSPRCAGCGKKRPSNTPKPTATSIIRSRPIPIEIPDDSPPRPTQSHRVISTTATSVPGRVQMALQQRMAPRQPALPSAWYNFTIFLARPQSDGRDWDHFLRAMNTRLANEPIDGFSTFHALLLSAAKSPLSRPDDLRFVRPELDGAGEWIMAYNKPTSLRVPLSSVMEWSGKRTFTDIFKEDPRFETKKLGNTNELTVNVYFAWKPDSLCLQEEETVEEEEEQVSASTKKAKKGGKKGKASSRLSLGSPEKRKKARTRLQQAQLEEKEVVVKREPGDDDEVKEEKDTDDGFESDLPSINNIINGRS